MTVRKEPEKYRQSLVTIVCAFFLMLFGCIGVLASELDDVLSGFDDPAPGDTKSGELEDVLAGFDESESQDESQQDEEKILPAWLDLSGTVSLFASWNYLHDAPPPGETDFRDLSMLRTTASLTADIDLQKWRFRISGHTFYDAAYAIQGRDDYSGQLLTDYERELEVDELYLAGSLTDNLDLKIGRQVVVWGKADNLRVTDVLNPLDNRVPGLVDIKYKRLPVTMTKLDYYSGPWNVSGIVVNEVRFDKNPVFGSDFYPGSTVPPPEREATDFAIDDQQYGLAINGIFSGWDFSLYQAWIYDKRSHVVTHGGTPVRIHNRVAMSGITANMALGSWLFKGEAAWWQGLEYTTAPGEEFERLDLMAGIEYTGFSETVLSLEFVNRHMPGFEDRLGLSPDFLARDQQQTVFMYSRDFAHDTVNLKILCSLFGSFGDDGAFERVQVEYDLTDHVTLSGGVMLYQSGDQGGFSNVEDNDRLFFEYSYAF